MIAVSLYFVIYQSKYIEKQEDGSYRAKPCSCHPADEEHDACEEADQEKQEPEAKFCASYCKQASCGLKPCGTRGRYHNHCIIRGNTSSARGSKADEVLFKEDD